MWLDNASDIDMLFYSPYAKTIVNFTKNSELTPFTIGLYGSWGAGKSSLLHLIKQSLEKETKIELVNLNAWQFEGYEDAKIAIMESLLLAVKEMDKFRSVGEKIKNLIQRVDLIRLGKDLAKRGAPYVIGAATGNPIPIAVNVGAELADLKSLPDKINDFKANYIKDDSKTAMDNVRKFRNEFEKMLSSVNEIDNLVVIVDDLDRCSPDRIIDTLEAIKLFLSVKKTTFIIAVDQRIIEYAVNTKYPQIEGFGVSSDYIEKIIQLPIKIPELSSKDIENYMLLLIYQLYLTHESFEKLVEKIYSEKYMLSEQSIKCEDLEKIRSDGGLKCKLAKNDELQKDAAIIEKIRSAISSSLKGNPRQTKRFLNTFFVRKNLASLYFENEIDLSIMAKLLALEFIDMKSFRKLYEWNNEFDGENKQLKELESAVLSNSDVADQFSAWNNTRMKKWIQSEPTELYKCDLSKYFYLSRESLVSVEALSASFSEKERKMLSDIVNCMQGQEDNKIEKLQELDSVSQNKIVEAIIQHFNSDTVQLRIISRVFDKFPDFRQEIVDSLNKKNKDFFTLPTEPLLSRMYIADSNLIDDFLQKASIDGKISSEMVTRITKCK